MMRTNLARRGVFVLALGLGLSALPGAAGASVGAPGCRAGFTIANQSARPVQEVFRRASGSTAWGQDLLGDAVLRAGNSLDLAPAGSQVDVMVLLADGTARVLWRLDACRVARVTLTDTLALRAE